MPGEGEKALAFIVGIVGRVLKCNQGLVQLEFALMPLEHIELVFHC